MSNHETFEPMGLVDLTLASAQAKLKKNRERLDDMTERLQSALDAKRDVASDYSRQLHASITHNDAMWKSGYDVGYAEGYKEGVSLSNNIETRINAMTLDEVSQELVRGGISVADQDQLVDDVEKMIEDKDADEPDQYPDNYGGTK